jgi:phytoene synthase
MTTDFAPEQAERMLALSYAAATVRDALAALLALDNALALLLRTTRQPSVGQLRLAWWRESLAKLDRAPAPTQPVLQALQRNVLCHGVTGASLVSVVHGWEVLVEEARLETDALERFATGRGSLFASAGVVLGAAPGDPLETAGQGWALADLGANLSVPHEAEAARALARPLLSEALQQRWSRQARSLGAMTHLARMELENSGGPVRRVGRLFWHRLSGR